MPVRPYSSPAVASSSTLDAYGLFIGSLAPDYVNAIFVLYQRAKGDSDPDEPPRQFPKFNRPGEAVRPWTLFEKWVGERKPAASTVQRWRAVLLQLDAKFPDANAISEDQARDWIRGLVAGDRTAITVRETWLAAANRIFRYGVDQ